MFSHWSFILHLPLKPFCIFLPSITLSPLHLLQVPMIIFEDITCSVMVLSSQLENNTSHFKEKCEVFIYKSLILSHTHGWPWKGWVPRLHMISPMHMRSPITLRSLNVHYQVVAFTIISITLKFKSTTVSSHITSLHHRKLWNIHKYSLTAQYKNLKC